MLEIPDGYFLSVVFFFAIVGLIIYKDRKNMEFHTFIVMRRTKRFMDLIYSIADLSPRFWRAASTVGMFAGFGVMAYGFYMLLMTARSVMIGAITQPAVQLILPTPSSTASVGPGYMLIPFWFWLVTIAFILIPHEMMHGIIARAEKIRLKSVGLLLLAIFPGAFVEPDESQLQRSRLLTRLRIFSAGSFANFLIAAVVLGLMAFVIWPAVANPGVVVESVSVGSPAAQAGMQAGMVLSEINGKPITSTYWEFMGGKGYFADELGTVSVGTKMNFVSGGEQYLLTAAENPETKGPYIGITYKPIMKLPITEFFSFGSLVTMIWLFSFAVGMVNILPLFPLDGGLMFDAVAKKFIAKKRAVLVTRIVTYFLVLVLVFDFLGPWLISLVKGLLGL